MSETLMTTRRMRGRPVTADEANASVLRLIGSRFGSTLNKAKISIPVRADDDDVTVMDYIEELEEQVRQLREVVRRLMLVLPDYRSEVEAMEFARTTLIYTEPKP